jgi:hypothetical protein
MTDAGMPQKITVATGLFLGLSCLLCLYQWKYGAQDLASDGLNRLTTVLNAEAAAPSPAAGNRGPVAALSMPDLLARIQETATASEIIVKTIAPAAANAEELQLTAGGDFRNMMRFLARLETLPIAVTALDLSQDENGDAVLALGLLKSPKPAAPASMADYIDAITQYSAVRDPFSAGDPIPLTNAGSELGDLSWTYHLSSISLLGAVRIATIDGKDYQIGDALAAMKITAIGPSSVTLQAPGKALPQKLHFRRNPDGGGRP